MIELNFYPLMGLFEELYRPDLKSLSLKPLRPTGRWALQRANSLFWARLLSRKCLRTVLDRLQSKYLYQSCDIPQYDAVLRNPELFIKRVISAPTDLANHGTTPQKFFSALETLTVACNLYSDFIYKPHKLTVDDGFLLDDFSSKVLVENCLNPLTNPYLQFIEEECWPIIRDTKPDLIWMLGPIRFSTFTMALLARNAFPKVHISVVGHSSEYYSLNKITKYLETNSLLFSVIDSIILDDTEHTQSEVVRCIADGISLQNIPNVMYINRDEQQIVKTKFQISKKNVSNWVSTRPRSFPRNKTAPTIVDPSELVNIKLWPDSKCYWNRCTFCGINHKYHTLPEWNNFEEISEKVDIIAHLVKGGCRYFWLIDEAVPPDVLDALAKGLIERQLKVHWQARSRIDKGYTPEICENLSKAGLRELRLGLESANYRILKLMDKFPDDFDLSLVEQIVSNFHQNGVSVHFPMIVGFPTETMQERVETFEFLQSLKRKYPSFSFNVNALDLDVASKLFKHYEEFDITSIEWPYPARYFLGNFVGWDSNIEHFDKNTIDIQRSNFMRQVLYPWMPKTALTPTFIFYRLSETSRITLVWKTQALGIPQKQETPLSIKSRVCKSSGIVCSQLNRRKNGKDLYRVYDWETHNFIECDEDGVRLLDIFSSPKTVQEGLNQFWEKYYSGLMYLEEVFAKYLPQLQIASQYQLVIEE